MKQTVNNLQTAVIEKLSHDGRGIARIEGKTTFIRGALPDETVEFEILKRKRDFDEGRVVSIIHASPNRVEPKCAHFGVCGGCSLQHIKETSQIQEKQALLIDILQRMGHCQPEEMLPALSAKHWHYRHKARLSVRYHAKQETVFVGFREKINPRYIARIQHCSVLNQKVSDQLEPLKLLIASLDDPASIAQVELAAGDDEIALIFRNMSGLSQSDEQKLIDFAKISQFRIYLQPNRPDSIYLLYPSDCSDYLSYRLPEYHITFQFHPTDFTQINPDLNQKMVTLAINLLDLNAEDVVLDLFCGLGNFSLPIAKSCAKVIGIEGSESMVQRAAMNAAYNQIQNATFFSANLDDKDALAIVSSEKMNKLLLDPPRAGALEIVKQIEKLNPEKIVYVSCNPATLARDADILVNQKGYRMTKAGVMDMFPHTEHVESIAVFDRESTWSK